MNATGYSPVYKRVAVFEPYDERRPDVGEWRWFSPIVHFTSEKHEAIASDVLASFVQDAVESYLVSHIVVFEFPNINAFKTLHMRES